MLKPSSCKEVARYGIQYARLLGYVHDLRLRIHKQLIHNRNNIFGGGRARGFGLRDLMSRSISWTCGRRCPLSRIWSSRVLVIGISKSVVTKARARLWSGSGA